MYLFAILEGKTEKSRVIKHTFTDYDYTRAKLYFRAWIGNDRPERYTLYKIGNVTPNNMIEPVKVFVADGLHIAYTAKKEYYQQNLFSKKKEAREYKKTLEEAKKATSQAEIIEKLFNGRIINERRDTKINN